MKCHIISRVYLSIIPFLLLFAACGRPAEVKLVAGHSETINVSTPHLERQGTAVRMAVDGKPFLLIAGELHNSTSGGLEPMRKVWKRMARKNLNTVIATVSWELIEPEEGKFDFNLVDSMIAGARKEDLKLVLIWFGSWKNAGSVYVPSYIKKDYGKYPRAKEEKGRPLEIISTFSGAAMEKDALAFSRLMAHIRDIDSSDHTVIMMQVENEAGLLDTQGETPGNARRDFCEAANQAYNGSVPPGLIKYLTDHKSDLHPELFRVWSENGFRTSGNWEEIFGKSTFKSAPEDWKYLSFYTEELFMAWNYATYIGKVAAAGKKEYNIPMYVNAWLKQPSTRWPGRYPSGGPLPQVLDIWRAAAPAIDFIAPDIYIDEFAWTCSEFRRGNNPLFIPETVGGKKAADRAFYVFGEFDASCFAPFGIDNPDYAENDPLDKSYAALRKLAPLITDHQGRGEMHGILTSLKEPVSDFVLGDFKLRVILDKSKGNDTGGGIIIQTGRNDFICAGRGFDLFFTPARDTMRIGLDYVDEGTIENGSWITQRRLNGDETHASTYDGTGLKFPPERVSIQKMSIYYYR